MGDTVLVPGGSSTWSSGVSIPDAKGITLDGGGATINGEIGIDQNPTTPSRITNFHFTKTHAVGTYGTKTSAPFRIDHNTFTVTTGGATLLDVAGNAPGLVDHNTFTAPLNAEMIHNWGMGGWKRFWMAG